MSELNLKKATQKAGKKIGLFAFYVYSDFKLVIPYTPKISVVKRNFHREKNKTEKYMELMIIVYLKTLFLSVDNMTLRSINSN